LSACFVPGDRHVLLGTKEGKLVLVDIASGDILEEVPAHSKELWSVSLYPDQVRIQILYFRLILVPTLNLLKYSLNCKELLQKDAINRESNLFMARLRENGNKSDH